MPIVNRQWRNPVWLLTVLAAVACTASPQSTPDLNAPRPAAPTVSASPTSSAPRAGREPVAVTPPSLDEGTGETLAGRYGPARGGAHFAYDAGPRGKALVVAVSCRGTGKVSVDLPALDVSVSQPCSPHETAVTHNEFAQAAVGRSGTVSVTAPSTVEWAVTVGRGDEPVEDGEVTGPTAAGS